MNSSPTEHETDRGFWIAAAVAGLNATVSMGFGIAAAASQHTATSWFAADRTAALLTLLVAVVALRRHDGLLLVGSALVTVQAADAAIRAATGTASGAVGPAVIALLTVAALLRLRRGAPTRATAGLHRPTTG